MKLRESSGRAPVQSRPVLATVRSLSAALLLALVLVGACAILLGSAAQAAEQVSLGTLAPSFPAGEPAGPKITSSAAIVIDTDTGEVLYSHAANKRLPMASTTKIMTGILVIESLGLDTEVTISGNAAGTYGSMLGFRKGEVLSAEELLYALLVPSANDAAIALAEASAGSVSAFVKKMNAKATELGMTNTHFVNPNGLNADHHFSSARDMAVLAAYAMKNETFRKIVATKTYIFMRPGEKPGELVERKGINHNTLLLKYPWITGVKTGQTPYAKFCLVASATKDDVNLVAVVLGAKDDITRQKEAKALLLHGFDLNPITTLAGRGQTELSVDAQDALGRKIRLVAGSSLALRLHKTAQVEATAVLNRGGTLPVQQGDAFGEVRFSLDGQQIGAVPLVAAESMEKASIEMILMHWQDAMPTGTSIGDRLHTLS
jgi:serine-type D-Ala-D-Ala carboxypeptidase (penicillin-binding protein 5/6)